MTYEIVHLSDGKYKLDQSTSSQQFSTVLELISHYSTENNDLRLQDCIPPSEYGM